MLLNAAKSDTAVFLRVSLATHVAPFNLNLRPFRLQ